MQDRCVQYLPLFINYIIRHIPTILTCFNFLQITYVDESSSFTTSVHAKIYYHTAAISW